MKLLLSTMALFMSFSAFSETIVRLLDVREDYFNSVRFQYEVNKDQGRAWITVVGSDYMYDDSGSDEHFRVLVPDMSYDSAEKTIKIDSKTKGTIVCANLVTKGRGVFKTESIKTTGDCVIKHSVESRTFDDGFEITTRKYDVWDLIIE